MTDKKLTYTPSVKEIDTTSFGVSELLKFYNFAIQHRYCSIVLNLSPLNSVDANLSALILAIAYKLKQEYKIYVYVELASHMNVFFRNGLISHLTGKGNTNQYGDDRNSTIPLSTFPAVEAENFCKYLKSDFFSHRGLDGIANGVKIDLSTHFEEVFVNVQLHANTTYPVFTCGQYFPEKQILKFTLVDLGDGFYKKIALKDNLVKTDKDAILWATYKLNSTKDVAIWGPGGTGLKELKNYCAANNGSLHICSGNGFVNFSGGRTMEHNLLHPLKGSLVNLIFRKL